MLEIQSKLSVLATVEHLGKVANTSCFSLVLKFVDTKGWSVLLQPGFSEKERESERRYLFLMRLLRALAPVGPCSSLDTEAFAALGWRQWVPKARWLQSYLEIQSNLVLKIFFFLSAPILE